MQPTLQYPEFECTIHFINFVYRGDLACNIALDAVQTVVRDHGDRKEIDIKNYAKVEKVYTCTA